MRRTTLLPAATLLCLTLIQPAPTSAVGETCHGVAATHVGSYDQDTLVGTEGADVIVSNGAEHIHALGGDDLICVSVAYWTYVEAGDGNDVVDASSDEVVLGVTETTLGTGADRYLGSTAIDHVTAGAKRGLDRERDVIDTGPSRDGGDEVESGQVGLANPDEIRLGRGRLDWRGNITSKSTVHGSARSVLTLGSARSKSLSIDSEANTVTLDAQPLLRIPGFSYFGVVSDNVLRDLSIRGTDRDDFVTLSIPERRKKSAPIVKVTLGGGDDLLVVTSRSHFHRSSSFAAGKGDDYIALGMYGAHHLHLDLGRGQFSTGPAAREFTAVAAGFEDAEVAAHNVEVVGSNGPNSLYVHGCSTGARGLSGDDRIGYYYPEYDNFLPAPIACPSRRARLFGGVGNDKLIGSPGRDHLIGGKGKDSAEGGRGRDRCSAEKSLSCEVPLADP